MLDKLAQFHSSTTTSAHIHTRPSQPTVCTTPSFMEMENPTCHIQKYTDEYITADQESKLLDYLSKQTFSDVKSRYVIAMGLVISTQGHLLIRGLLLLFPTFLKMS